MLYGSEIFVEKPFSNVILQNDWLPHGFCMNWSRELLLAYLFSDGIIFISYIAISAALAFFTVKRNDLIYKKTLWLFAAFILACGASHFMDAYLLWKPFYSIDIAVKIVTAGLSIITVFYLLPLIPKLLTLPSLSQLLEINRQLNEETKNRQSAEKELIKYRNHLEELVKQKTKLLHETNIKITALVNNAIDGIITIHADGRIESINPAAERIFGYSANELIGENIGVLMPEPYKAEHDSYLNNYLRTGQQKIIGLTREVLGLRKNGNEFYMELSVSETTLENQRLFTGIVRDISGRKLAEAALRESEERLELALDVTPGGVWDWNLITGKLLLAPKWLKSVGYSAEEFKPHIDSWRQRIHPDDRLMSSEKMQAHFEGKTPSYECEYRLQTKQGDWMWRYDRGKVVAWDANGKPLRMVGIDIDISENKRMMTELLKTQKLMIRSEKLASIGTLSAGVAHEILNPLNIISILAQMELKKDILPETATLFEKIKTQVDRAAKITNTLREFSHLKKDQVAPVDIRQLFDKTALLIEHDLNAENITIERRFANNLPIIDSDEDKLAQVFINLLTNARDAMHDGKNNKITVEVKPATGGIEILFTDTGTGIPDAIINKVFDPFFTTKEPGKGTGMGLYITHTIIESMGGAIDVKSAPGKGATFIIHLPIHYDNVQ